MKYLLDTHILLWWFSEPGKISKKARTIIEDKAIQIFVSSVSFWEIAIKQSIGKITIPRNLLHLSKEQAFEILPLHADEALSIVDLPDLHKDPFDRILISQAKMNDLIIITRDKQIRKYPIITLKG